MLTFQTISSPITSFTARRAFFAPLQPLSTTRPCIHVKNAYKRKVSRNLTTAQAQPITTSLSGKNQEKQPKSGSKSTKSSQSASITPRSQDYSQWYLDVISEAQLAEPGPVRGSLVIRPHGFAIWEALRDAVNTRIRQAGVQNAYFPLLIPQSFLSREAEHVSGFAKECAVVTHHRLQYDPDGLPGQLRPDPDSKLEEPLLIRPTSETIIWNMYAKWIHSYRDLPLKLNQWANIVRWEMRTRPFLRTTEFLWQEGHTAHATAEEADEFAKKMVHMYDDVARDLLAIPTVLGVKSPNERFAGGLETYTIEAFMQNGWALQAATSHFLGQTFAKAFDCKFQTADGDEEYVWATSWGLTTRMVGAVIMTHSDDTGLVLPPAIASTQVALVLIFKNDEQKKAVKQFADVVATRLQSAGILFEVDDRENMRPGAKYYEWERKGVPLRMEIGPKDAAKQAVFAARRIGGPKESVPVDNNFETKTRSMLDKIQSDMYNTALDRLNSRIYKPSSYEEMKVELKKDGDSLGFCLVPWKSDEQNEIRVKEETKATLRCFPLENQQDHEGKTCIYSGEPATHMAIFARAY